MGTSGSHEPANDTEGLDWSPQSDAVRDISMTLNAVLADLFTL